MARVYESRNLSLTPDQWRLLEAIAVQTNSRSTRGIEAHQISWRKLIERVAIGDFHLVEKTPYKIPDSLERAVKAVTHRHYDQLDLLESEPA